MANLDYGWAAPDLPTQLKEQGLALEGDRGAEEWASDMFESIRQLYARGIITQGEMRNVTGRFVKKIAICLRPAEEYEEANA